MSATEASTVSNIVPMVMGNLSQRQVISPKTAAVANRRLRICRIVIGCLKSGCTHGSEREDDERPDQ